MKNSLYWIAMASLALLAIAFAQDGTAKSRAELRDRFVVSGDAAYGMMPADLVSGPETVEVHWAPTGRFILVEQVIRKSAAPSSPADERRLSVYDRRTRISDVLWRFAADRGSVGEVEWLAGTETALVTVSESAPVTRENPSPLETSRLLRVSAPSASARLVPGGESPDGISIFASPTHPYAFIERIPASNLDNPLGAREMAPRSKGALHLLKATGGLGPAIPLPASGWTVVMWSEEGEPYLRHVVRETGKPAKMTTYALDVQSGKATEVAKPPKLVANQAAGKPEPGGLRLRETAGELTEGGVTSRLHPVWLETSGSSDRPRALVNSNSTWSSLSPKGDAALYISDRSAWLVPIVRLQRSAYDDLMRQAVMSDARMVGLAMRMYCEDYDNRFPLSDHMAGGAVNPYLKDDRATDGFNYQYPGESTKDVKNPADTAVGFIAGPGGRAWVYVDGHVKWLPDK